MNRKEIEIIDYGYSGEGVGKINGKVYFVPYALKGEVVEVEIKKETSSFCKCKLIRVLKASADRIVPPCPYFGNCGGCAFQNLEYNKGLEIKLEKIKEQFLKIGYSNEIQIFKSPYEYGYRNKIKLFCCQKGLALNQEASNNLVPIKKCLLVKDNINNAIKSLQTFINAKNLASIIQNVYIRSQGENLLVLFCLKKKVKIDYSGIQIMLGARSGIKQVVGNGKLEQISGVETLKAKEFELDCEFEVTAFHQVNDEVCEALYKDVINNIKGDKVINAYSGAGVLSGIIAKSGKTVYGIELGKSEHESAEKLKEINKLGKLFNIQDDCAKVIPKLITEDHKTLVDDPPRAGISKEVCEAIEKSKIENLIYISCNSATLVRDISRLASFNIKSVKAFDMFPQTSSCEVLTILERKKK